MIVTNGKILVWYIENWNEKTIDGLESNTVSQRTKKMLASSVRKVVAHFFFEGEGKVYGRWTLWCIPQQDDEECQSNVDNEVKYWEVKE